MDLGDVASGELHHGGFSPISLVWGDQDLYASHFRFSECVGEVVNFISRGLSSSLVSSLDWKKHF
jgi:hypothetical protein